MPDKPPSPKGILATARAFQESRVLLTAFELDLFTALDQGPLEPAQAAEAVRADPRATHRLLAALAAMGLVRLEPDGRFVHTPESAVFLSRNSPACLGSLMHLNNLYPKWGTLTQAVRAGTRVFPPEDSPESATRDFIAAMHHRAVADAKALAGLIDMEGVERILDVGGGSGAYSMAFCRANENARAVVLDQASVTPITREYVAAQGLSERVSTMDGDYLSADFGSGYDLVLFSAILHINSPEQNRALMRKAFACLGPGGRVAVKEFLLDNTRTKPKFGALFALNMLVNAPGGDAYTEGEIASWLAEAGFDPARRLETGGEAGLLVARKP